MLAITRFSVLVVSQALRFLSEREGIRGYFIFPLLEEHQRQNDQPGDDPNRHILEAMRRNNAAISRQQDKHDAGVCAEGRDGSGIG